MPLGRGIWFVESPLRAAGWVLGSDGVLVQSGVQPVSCRISAWSKKNVDASNAVRSEMERVLDCAV